MMLYDVEPISSLVGRTNFNAKVLAMKVDPWPGGTDTSVIVALQRDDWSIIYVGEIQPTAAQVAIIQSLRTGSVYRIPDVFFQTNHVEQREKLEELALLESPAPAVKARHAKPSCGAATS